MKHWVCINSLVAITANTYTSQQRLRLFMVCAAAAFGTLHQALC